MRLVDEIEAAAKVNGSDGLRIVLPDYWDRIKAALLAGDAMAGWIIYEAGTWQGVASLALANARRFRAATEGAK